jgi:hypothetical protein
MLQLFQCFSESRHAECSYAGIVYAEYRIFVLWSVVMLSVIMLSIVMLSILILNFGYAVCHVCFSIMLSVIMRSGIVLSVVVLNVMAP